MKKFFTLILACASACIASFAADLELLFGNTPVVSTTTYETFMEATTIHDAVLGDFYQYMQNSNLYLRGANGTDVTVVVTADHDVAVCSITGSCSNGTNVTKQGTLGQSDVTETNGNIVTVDLRIDKQTTSFGTPEPPTDDITVNVTAYPTANPNNKLTAKVIMRARTASSIAVENEPYHLTMVRGNTLTYNLEQPATLQIFAITGNLVGRYPVSGSGSLNLSALPKGIYICSAGKLKGKIVIR